MEMITMKHKQLLITSLWAAGLFATARNAPAAEPSASGPVIDWNIVGNIPLERVVIQSHRGAGVLAEENTLAAFELGWKLGTYPESDLRTTTDGAIVTFHDDNFSRVVKGVSSELAKKG